MNRTVMYPAASLINDKQNTVGAASMTNERTRVARAKEVAKRAHNKTGEDRARHRRNTGIANVALSEAEVVTDDGDQGGCRKGGDVSGAKGDPT